MFLYKQAMLELGVVLHLIITEHLHVPEVVVVVPPLPPLPPLPLLAVGPPAPVNPRVLLSLTGPGTGGLVAVVERGGVLQLLLLLLLLLGGVVDPPALHLPLLSPGRHLRLNVGVLQDGDPGVRAGAGPGCLLLVVVVQPGVVVVLPGQVEPASLSLSCNTEVEWQ